MAISQVRKRDVQSDLYNLKSWVVGGGGIRWEVEEIYTNMMKRNDLPMCPTNKTHEESSPWKSIMDEPFHNNEALSSTRIMARS